MTVVVSIGGSVLGPTDPDSVRGYAEVIRELGDEGSIGVVAGGGTTAREYIRTARDLGANEMKLDDVGIHVTRLHARILSTAIPAATTPPPVTYEEAAARLKRGEIPIMGGVQPGQTTDAVGAALAEYVDAERLVLATSVPGVFDADPNHDPDATRFDRIESAELVERMADLSVDAGSSAPVDLLAAKLIDRSGLSTVVVDGSDPRRILDAARGEPVDGTTIVPG